MKWALWTAEAYGSTSKGCILLGFQLSFHKNHDYPCAFQPIAASGRRPGTTEILGVHNLRSEIYGYSCDDRKIKFNNTQPPRKKYPLVVSIALTESTLGTYSDRKIYSIVIFYVIHIIQNIVFLFTLISRKTHGVVFLRHSINKMSNTQDNDE